MIATGRSTSIGLEKTRRRITRWRETRTHLLRTFETTAFTFPDAVRFTAPARSSSMRMSLPRR